MIRLVLLLGAGLYIAFMVLGQDNGQKRHGLVQAADTPPPSAPASPAASVFIPAQPVMQASAKPALPSPAAALTPPAAPEPASLPQPEFADGLLYTVAARQANVRGGPGRNFAVIGSLTRGEQVLVVIEQQPLEGWSRIRVEGDGIEGYMSTRLLTRSE